MELVGAGKGSARRKGANDKAYADGYDAIFGKKVRCPKCNSANVSTMWRESSIGEWEHAECEACGNEWNESARD